MIWLAPLLALPLLTTQVPSLEGVWTGTDQASGQPVSIHVVGPSMILTDRKGVLVARWAFTPTKPDGQDYALDIVALSRVSRDGSVDALPKGEDARTSRGTLRVGETLRLCAARPGTKRRAPVVLGDELPPETRCLTLRRGADTEERFRQCVTKCVRGDQMRAVGPDVIERDCRDACRKPLTLPK